MKTSSHGFDGSFFRRTTTVRWGLQQPANLTVAASAGTRRTTTKGTGCGCLQAFARTDGWRKNSKVRRL
uniref:Uncharacterized protein n=1 Tax=Cucumis melo TaxID=3656 RepID=A0A9I9E392_CUCME